MSDKEDEIDLKDMENHIKDEAKKLQDQRSAAILEQLKKARWAKFELNLSWKTNKRISTRNVLTVKFMKFYFNFSL